MGASGLGSGKKPHDTSLRLSVLGAGGMCLEQHLNTGRSWLSAARGGDKECSTIWTGLSSQTSGSLLSQQQTKVSLQCAILLLLSYPFSSVHGEGQVVRKRASL